MMSGWQKITTGLIAMGCLLAPTSLRADISVTGSFGPNGDIGFVSSPSNLNVTFGGDSQGVISQMDAFVSATGHDFGNGAGMSADLANGAPAGLSYTFSANQPTVNQLLFTYSFTNTSGAALNGFQFLYYIDGDIGDDFTDETVTTNNLSRLGTRFNPTRFQAGDATGSSIFYNASQTGTLNNTNSAPAGSPADVAMAFSYSFGTLGAGQTVQYNVLVSDNLSQFNDFALTQHDPINTTDTLTISGSVPEPASWLSLVVGSTFGIGYARRRSRTRPAQA